ncbi:MAG: MBL fold metallo-hydrolase [Candidatus Dormibacteria bacterium]|jgi:glyoxylase-like metal-dependent hydrolase (beta-lactamase superfamily II)
MAPEAPAHLTIEVYTAPGRTFVSAIAPQGPGDEPTWSPSTATLIYGDSDAVLVDALATNAQVDALADWIATKGRRLSRIYITHGHGDHWLGLARLTQRFPGAIGLATAEVLAQATDPSIAGYWEAIFPGEVPTGAEKVLPQLLSSDTIDLEGEELRVIRIGRADTAESTLLHIPSLGAVVTGDLAYNEVHMMTAEAGEPERGEWIANLDKVASLHPSIVIAGHKKVENGNDPKIIEESQQYLRDFSRIAAEETTAAGIVARMVERYPDWANGRTLWHSARTEIARKDR